MSIVGNAARLRKAAATGAERNRLLKSRKNIPCKVIAAACRVGTAGECDAGEESDGLV